MRASWFLMSVVSLWLASPARANPCKQAKAEFGRAQALLKRGATIPAVRALRKAYGICPAPRLLFYVGQAFQGVKLYPEAARAYWRFLDESSFSDPRRPKALAALKALKMPRKPPPPKACPPCRTRLVAPPPRRTKRRRLPLHEVLDEARPHHPTLLAADPHGNVAVFSRLYLYYRPRGAARFTKRSMKPDRRKRYWGCIPARHMRGRSVQYYIDVVAVTGRRVAGSGTRRSPNIILLSTTAKRQPGALLRRCP